MRIQSLLACVLATTALSACSGPGPLASDPKVTTYTQDGDNYAQLSLKLNIGDAKMPSVNLPIPNPSKPTEILGNLSLADVVGGKGAQLGISIDLSKVIKADGTDGSLLPNGNPIPIGVPSDVQVMAFTLKGTNTRVYFAFGNGVAMFGAAITVKEISEIGKYFPGFNYFPTFGKSGQVNGVAGLFTSSNADNNGLAVFVDMSSALNGQQILAQSQLSTKSVISQLSASTAKQKSRLVIKSIMPSGNVRQEFENQVYDISGKVGRMHLN